MRLEGRCDALPDLVVGFFGISWDIGCVRHRDDQVGGPRHRRCDPEGHGQVLDRCVDQGHVGGDGSPGSPGEKHGDDAAARRNQHPVDVRRRLPVSPERVRCNVLIDLTGAVGRDGSAFAATGELQLVIALLVGAYQRRGVAARHAEQHRHHSVDVRCL